MSSKFALVPFSFTALLLTTSFSATAQRINGENFANQLVTNWFEDSIQVDSLYMPLDKYLLWMDIQPGSEALREQSKAAILTAYDSLYHAFVLQMNDLKEEYGDGLLESNNYRNVTVNYELVRGVRHLYAFTIRFQLKIKRRWIPTEWAFEAVWFDNQFYMLSPIEEAF
ncbi:MAG: hypothetical protein LAT76_06375 [Schleiferiaceae bacterium]|nr:hypothetical protein [Schleiferiaceae bacterium]